MSAHRLKVTINNTQYIVELDDPHASPLSVTVNGKPYTVNIEAVQAAPVAVQPVSPDGGVSTPKQKVAAPAGPANKVVTAPMPGNIARVSVRVGERVSAGQELCALEAMKMVNAIRAPWDGVIAEVTAAPGQTVNHGDVLVTFE